MKNREPDYLLKCMNKVTGDKGHRIGALWVNPDKTLSLIMDIGCHAIADRQLTYTFFINDKAIKQ